MKNMNTTTVDRPISLPPPPCFIYYIYRISNHYKKKIITNFYTELENAFYPENQDEIKKNLHQKLYDIIIPLFDVNNVKHSYSRFIFNHYYTIGIYICTHVYFLN